VHGGFEGRGVSIVAAAHVRFRSSFEGHLRFAFGLFELDEERHANHAHGDDLTVLDGQLA